MRRKGCGEDLKVQTAKQVTVDRHSVPAVTERLGVTTDFLCKWVRT